MDDAHVISGQGESNSSSDGMSGGKKAAIIISALLIIILLAGGSYFLGTQTQEEDSEPSPTPSLTQLETEPTPEATDSAETTPSATTSTPTPTPTRTTRILSPIADLDGFRSSNGGGNDSVDIRAGRNQYLVARGFVSFDLGDLPAGASVTEATLRLYQTETVGSPYSVGGALRIDHLTYGDSLDDSDYSLAALLSSFATLTNNSTVEWKDADVTQAVKNDVANGRSQSQFRIHFTTENKGGGTEGDFAYFESAENDEGTGNTPQLIVEYY